jgi:hypothetical protein
MEFLPGLLAVQLIATVAGFVWLWRRQQRLSTEIDRLQRALQEVQARNAVAPRRARRGASATVVPLTIEAAAQTPASPLARAARAWKLPNREPRAQGSPGPMLTPDAARGLTLALMATLPAFGLFLGVEESALAAAGLAMAAAMMLIALRPTWRVAAWAGVLTAAAWATIGFVRGAALADPVSYSVCVALAAAAGLAHAYWRGAAPGGAMALAMGAAALALASQTGMIGPPGAAFGLMVAAAALVGASRLRLEPMHLASFGAALIGLFVLSGQHSAAIWFTPAAAWMGALYFGVSVIRVPQLGARGAALAATGAMAPFAAIAALHASQHGLADRFAAGAAFAVLALLLAALITASALRDDRGARALKLTLWVLAAAAFTSAASAVALALSGPLAASGFAALALGLAALNVRIPNAVWRTLACAAGVLAALFALANGELVLTEAHGWPPGALVAAGVALPGALAIAAVALAARAGAQSTAGFFEALAIILCVATLNLAVRLLFTGGATLLQPVGLAEAGTHSAIWLAAALLVGVQRRGDRRGVRAAATHVLSIIGLAGAIGVAIQWIALFWAPEAAALAPRETVGLLLPGVLFWAHWAFWRARGAEIETRIALAAGALLLAACVTHAAAVADIPRWAAALAGAFSLALAIGVNFAPGVTSSAPASDFEEDLERHRRREQGRQLR